MESVKLKIAKYLANKRHTAFIWGRNDCHTLVLEMHDYLYLTDYLDDLYGKYQDYKGAYRLAKTWDAEQQMQFMGYDEVATMRDGDVVLTQEKHGYSSGVVSNRKIYTMHPDRGMVAVTTRAFRNANNAHTIWRYTNGS